MTDRFYLVWNPAAYRAPTCRHPTYAGAIQEARRLARANPSDEFIVLAALATARIPDPVEVINFDGPVTVPGSREDDDDLPF